MKITKKITIDNYILLSCELPVCQNARKDVRFNVNQYKNIINNIHISIITIVEH